AIAWIAMLGPMRQSAPPPTASAPPVASTPPPRPPDAVRPGPVRPRPSAEAPEPYSRPRLDDDRPREKSGPRLPPRDRVGRVAPPDDAFGAVDRAAEAMASGSVAFNTPRSMTVGQSVELQLLLSLEKSVEELVTAVTAAGEKEGARVQVARRMEAH